MIIYTRPPYPSYMTRPETAYPYILINAYDESTSRYVTPQSAPYIRSVLLDSGVHSVFRRLELKEYPGGHQAWIDRVYNMWRRVTSLVAESYVVVPDYPADYENNLTMRAWPYIANYIDSTDTIVGNIWCKPLLGKMCTRKEEKEMAWRLFLSKASKYISLNSR